jgi:carbamoyl-phosphate synthase large subunit
VVDTCQDKRKTARFLAQQGFAVPVTVSTQRMLQQTGGPKLSWPCYVKPWNGSAGRNHAIVRNREELRFFAQRIPHAICQEYLVGTEYTCDVYVDRKRTVRCVVPRQRLEVRSGEVSKARIVKDSGLMAEVATLATRLGAGPGVITVQVIVTSARRRVFIEINPRLGGGIPLAIQAGADMPYWLLAEMVGKQPRIRMDGFKNGLLMLRYDDEIWIPGKTL